MTNTTEVPKASEGPPEPPAPPKMLTLQIDDQIDDAIEAERVRGGGRVLSRSEAARRLMRRGAGLAISATEAADAGPPS